MKLSGFPCKKLVRLEKLEDSEFILLHVHVDLSERLHLHAHVERMRAMLVKHFVRDRPLSYRDGLWI